MKALTIFISSTFQDMGFERDCINRYIIPMLNEKYNPLGYEITAIDMRWGIFSKENDSETEREQNILKACFEVIDNSEPFFVSFVGNRFGWIPEMSVIKGLPYLNDKIKEQISSYYINKPSVTALEIIYGVFYKKNYKRSLIFMKDADKCRDQNVAQFRNIIAYKYKEAGYENNLITYSAPQNILNAVDIDSFIHIISEQLCRIIDDYLETSKEATGFKNKLDLPYYWVKFQGIDDILSDISSGNNLIIYGDEGFGKSCLARYLYNQLEADKKSLLFFHSVGETAASFDEKEMIYKWADKIKPGGPLEHLCSIEQEWRRFLDLLKLRGLKAKIVIDSIDKLPIISTKVMMFLGTSNIRYIITSRARLPMWEKFLRVKPILLKGLNKEDSVNVIQHICQNNAKNITPEIIQSILDYRLNENGCYSPLDIVTLLSFMNRLDESVFANLRNSDSALTEKGITSYLIRLSRDTPHEFEKLCLKLLDELLKCFGPDVLEPYYYIAHSIHGFTDRDLINILGNKFNSINYHLSRQYLGLLISKKNEESRWIICNNSFKNALNSTTPTYVLDNLSRSKYLKEESAYYAIINGNHEAFLDTFVQYGKSVLQSSLAAYRIIGAKGIADFILGIKVDNISTRDDLYSFLLYDLSRNLVFLDSGTGILYWKTINSFYTTMFIGERDSEQRFVGRSYEGLGDAYVKAYEGQLAKECYTSALEIYKKYGLTTRYNLCKSKFK